jgi:hypothetical protein
MCADGFCGFRFARINEPEQGLTLMRDAQLLDCRRVAIRNRAIRSYKHQHDNFPGCHPEGIDRIPSEIEGVFSPAV